MADVKDYIWGAPARRFGLQKCDAAEVATFFDTLEAAGKLHPDHVMVEAAKPKNPLHAAPGWFWDDDAAAAARHRYQVASTAISGLKRMVSVTVDDVTTSEPMAAYVQTGKTAIHGRGETYRSLAAAMADPLDRAQLLTRLLLEIRHLDRQWAVLMSGFPEIRGKWKELHDVVERELDSSDTAT